MSEKEKETKKGILGWLGEKIGLFPDSRGKGSSSFTLYVFSHIPIILFAGAMSYKLAFGSGKMIWPSWSAILLVCTPMIISWTSWIIHHKKLLDSLKELADTIGRSIGLSKGHKVGREEEKEKKEEEKKSEEKKSDDPIIDTSSLPDSGQ